MCRTHLPTYTDFLQRIFRGKAGTVQRHVQLYSFVIQCTCMGRLEYVCTTCEEHFTRRYSATRHNTTIHGNTAEIVSLLEYLVGRSSGRYRASYPFWYRKRRSKENRFVGGAKVADSMGDSFQPTGLQREQQGQYQYQYHQRPLKEQEPYQLT